MTENRNIGQEVQAEIVKTVRRGQEAVVEALKTWTDTVRTMTPQLPEVSLPFASRLPRPEELVGNAYDLAGKLLAGQRKFAEDVLHATAALLPGTGDNGAVNGWHAAGDDEQATGGKTTGGKTTGGKAAGKTSGRSTTTQKNGPAAS